MLNDISIAIVACFILIAVIAVYRISLSKTADMLNPIAIVCFLFVVSYFGKFLYLTRSDELVFSYNYTRSFDSDYLLLGIFVCMLGLLLFAAGFLFKAKKIRPYDFNRNSSPVHGSILVSSFIISSASLVFIYGGMSVQDVLLALNNRFALFESRGYLFLGLSTYKISVFLWLASYSGKPPNWKVAILITPAILFDLSTGSRGKLIFENLLPLLYLLHRINVININIKKLAVVSVALVFVALLYRSLVRDVVYDFNVDKTPIEIVTDNLSEFGSDFYSGPEAPYLDTMILLIEREKSYLLGSSLVAFATYPIPRAIFPEKPRGASSILTERYFPAYYYPNKIEMAFPFVSELYANFWFFGIVFLLPAGYICAYFYNKIGKSRPWISVLSIFIAIRMVLLFRNDLFNNFSSLIMILFIILTIHGSNMIITSQKRRSV